MSFTAKDPNRKRWRLEECPDLRHKHPGRMQEIKQHFYYKYFKHFTFLMKSCHGKINKIQVQCIVFLMFLQLFSINVDLNVTF